MKHLLRTLPVALVAVALSATLALSAGAATTTVPSSIASDCSVDVTSALSTWLASVPNRTTVSFATNGCYRIEGTLEFRGRDGLVFEGNGSTFRSFTPPDDQRAIWRVIDSTAFVFRNMTVKGSYTQGGTFTSTLQHAHAIDIRGSSVEIDRVSMADVAGDCVYFGLGYTSALNRSSGSLHDSSCRGTGRNGASVTAGMDIQIARNAFSDVGFIAIDIEPNTGAGWGAARVTADSNTIGRYYLYAYSIVENAPITDQAFTNNRVVGQGLRIGVVRPNGYRPANVTITGNSSDTAQWAPALEITNADGITVSGNTVPMSGGAFATVDSSCAVSISGNAYPGGTTQAKVAPWACTLDPSSGPVGTNVTITGSGFTGASSVSFNGAAASFAVVSDGQLTATVPPGATTGPITIKTPNGQAATATFTVSTDPLPASTTASTTDPTNTTTSSSTTTTAPPSGPTITSFSPATGPVGTKVTLDGSGFSGASTVMFNGVTATFTVVSDTRVVAVVPSNKASGFLTVTTPDGSAKSAKRYRVTK